MKDIHQLLNQADAITIAGHLKSKDFTPQELLDTVLERVEKVNPHIQAITELNINSARNQLKKLDVQQSKLAGIPTFFKDLFTSCQGMRVTNGSLALNNVIAENDDHLMQRYKSAGIILLGATVSPEFGTSYTTESTRFGSVRSPWNLEHSAGGSSGGAAAVVAARITPFAHGNDGGGSIRVPASCCGVFGLKPSRGLMPNGPFSGEGWAGMGTPHAITLSVRDSAALLDLTAGADLGAPYAAPKDSQTCYLKSLNQPIKKLKIAMINTIDPWGIDKNAKLAVEHAAKLCESLGHYVETTSLPIQLEYFLKDCFTIIGANTHEYIELLSSIQGKPIDLHLLEPRTRVILSHGKKLSGLEYVRAISNIHALGRTFARMLENYDVILTPTLAKAPPRLGELDSFNDKLTLEEIIEKFHSYSPFTAIFNATGQPAMSVPLYWTEKGLPLGAHFAGRFGEEITLLQLANQLEQQQPWLTRIPPISATNLL
ncbi:amidase [Acinetobacter baumannii]|uniref:amidase n=1 Tax=Acinetobacter baumannii TaxID=470 RepID=UPI00389286C5